MTSLTTLDLSLNQLTGTIPTELESLSLLQSLYLQNNQLTGTIPAGLVLLNIAEFDVSGNQLVIDTDNDGVPDYMDQCPDEGGFIHADGCPVDSDNDGVKVRRIAAFELISRFAFLYNISHRTVRLSTYISLSLSPSQNQGLCFDKRKRPMPFHHRDHNHI